MKNSIQLVIIFLIINTLGFILVKINSEDKINLVIHSNLKTLQTNYNMLDEVEKKTAIAIYNATLMMPRVLAIIQEANTASQSKKKLLREELHNLLKPFYANIKEIGIVQYHFVLKNNVSFYRAHKPSKFGDDLTNIREDYKYVNTTLVPVRGSVQGRLAHGFRNTFPLFDKQNSHIGAMEVTFSSEHVERHLNKIAKFHTHFLLDNADYSNKMWTRKHKTCYGTSAENLNYKIHLGTLHKKEKCIDKNKKELLSHSNEIKTKMALGKPFGIYQERQDFENESSIVSISYLPIPSFKNKSFSWFVSYQRSPLIQAIILNNKVIQIAIFFISLLIVFILYKQRFTKKLQKQQEEEKCNIIEQLNSASKSKSEFLANMSHEIRTPLNAILGFIDLLKEETKDKQACEYLKIIDESSKGLLQIIEDILDFSKIESGKLKIDMVEFNTKEELSVISSLFEAKCSEKNINLILEFEENVPEAIKTDPLRIKQIIGNFISNAIKFTQAGKNITLKFEYASSYLFVSVKDEGKGIAKDKLAHIFQPFSQEDSSTTRKYGGTGLGLSISSNLVQLLGGKIGVKSELGFGSEFYFSIPIIPISMPTQVNAQHTINVQFDNKKILLVEDNRSNQLFMTVLLKKLHIAFVIANDGAEAVALYKASKVNEYSLILMDENMPNMNGIEATKQILEYEKMNKLPHTPIVALTANALQGNRKKFLNAGMDEYITKPISKEKLIQTIQIIASIDKRKKL
ncbi:response regulator [Sulfurimonas sp. SAG-AH-194-I05]|nr:ATP-binding protein [Sulfurimonas sp. SAG-AH-194-I05]MDF1875326.1 response regulator [Sulfurimonas sp. SAG-AH-194-I05]